MKSISYQNKIYAANYQIQLFIVKMFQTNFTRFYKCPKLW
jgi:hypothetical protein